MASFAPEVLIVTFREDAHVPLVTCHLDARGVSWFHLATDEVGIDLNLRYSRSSNRQEQFNLAVEPDGRTVDLSKARSVWNRRRMVSPGDTAPVAGDPLIAQYVTEQRRSLVEGCLSTLGMRGGVRWINSPESLVRARPKLEQLAHAAAQGLIIPQTLCTDEPHQIRAFAAALGTESLVTKVVSPGTPLVGGSHTQYMIFTRRVDVRSVTDEALAAAPAIYQEEVVKEFETRTIVIDDVVLSCRIESQASDRTELDWRHYDFDRVAHIAIETPPQIARSLIEMCRNYGLTYGAFDMAVTPAGEWVFFELNPNGQWGWLEEVAGIPIGAALADALSR